MNITPDTNVLVRAAVGDDERQAAIARNLLKDAETIALSLSCLCEFVWVLRTVYRYSKQQISINIRDLLEVDRLVVDRRAVTEGLAALDGGGDFADGVIAYEGRVLGGETFVSFDRRAVALVEFQGGRAVRLE